MSEFQLFFPIIKSEVFERSESKIKIKRARALGVMVEKDSQLATPNSLRYFVKPPDKSYPLNLNEGYERYGLRAESYFSPNLNKLEKYLMENNGRTFFKNKEKQQICTSRSVLNLLMMTPYRMNCNEGTNSRSFRNQPWLYYLDWSIKAIKFANVIYLSQVKQVRNEKKPHEVYHFKYAQHCFADSPYEKPDIESPIDENNQLSCIFETSLCNFDILYAAEIMGVESKHPIKDFKNPEVLNNCRFVATKLLNQRCQYERSTWKTYPKLLHWWVQAYLGRVEDIYAAFKTDEGFVNKAPERIDIHEIPKNQKWKPEICKRFLCKFLNKVQGAMRDVDSPHITYEFKFDAKMKLIKYRIFEHDEKELFLTKEFIHYMQM